MTRTYTQKEVETMTLEQVRDFHRRLADEHKLIPPLSSAHAAMADAIDTHLAAEKRKAENAVTDEIVLKFQLAEAEFGEDMMKRGCLFDPALGVEYALRCVWPTDQRKPPTRDSESEGSGEAGRVSAVTMEYAEKVVAAFLGLEPLMANSGEVGRMYRALKSAQPSTNAIAQPVSVEELSQPTRNGEVVMDPSVLDWEYMYGWNACLKAMLSAAPKREGE